MPLDDTLQAHHLDTMRALAPPTDRDTMLLIYRAGDEGLAEATPYRYRLSTGTLAQVPSAEFEEVSDFEGSLENRPGATFHEQRLIVGGGPRRSVGDHPDQWQSVTCSRSPSPETGADRHFNLVSYNVLDNVNVVVPDGAFNFTVASDEPLEIQWLTTFYDYLVIGCDRGIWFARYLQPDPVGIIQVRRQSRIGANEVLPATTSRGFAYVGANGRDIFLAPGSQTARETWAPPVELTTFAAHITGPGVREMVWQQHPEERLWVLRTDGELVCCHFHGETAGWTRMPSGCRIISIAIQPGHSGRDDILWSILQEDPSSPTRTLARMTGENHVDCEIDAVVRASRAGRPAHIELELGIPSDAVVRMIDTAMLPHRYADRPILEDDEGRYCEAPFAAGKRVRVGVAVSARLQLPQVGQLMGVALGQPSRAASATIGMVGSTGGMVGITPDRLVPIAPDEPGMERDRQEIVTVSDADLSDTRQSLWLIHDSPGDFELTYLAVEVQGG